MQAFAAGVVVLGALLLMWIPWGFDENKGEDLYPEQTPRPQLVPYEPEWCCPPAIPEYR